MAISNVWKTWYPLLWGLEKTVTLQSEVKLNLSLAYKQIYSKLHDLILMPDTSFQQLAR